MDYLKPGTVVLFISILVVWLRIDRSQAAVAAPRIDTQPQRFDLNVGQTVKLPCNFVELDNEDKVVVWKRGLDVLSIDDELTITDTRFQIRKEDGKNGQNFILKITSLEPYDTADYTCSVTSNPPVEITHKVQINVAPTAKLVPATSPLLTRVGEEVVVKCTGSGNPPPTLSWRRKSSGVPRSPPSTAAYGRLRFERIQSADAGVYECRASNGASPDATAEIEIKVESDETSAESSEMPSAPWVETDMLYIPAGINSDVNLTCRYNAEPAPTTDWLFSGFKINFFDTKFKNSAQFAARHESNNYSESILVLRNVQEDNFGDYTCRVVNNLGTAERTIYMSGRPGPPALFIRDNTRLSWTVQSMAPVSEYKILYRLARDDTWTGLKIVQSSKTDQDGDIWEHSVPLDFLKDPAGSDYEIQLSAKNTLGWGSLARQYLTYKGLNQSLKAAATDRSNRNGSPSMKPSNWRWTLFSCGLLLLFTFLIDHHYRLV